MGVGAKGEGVQSTRGKGFGGVSSRSGMVTYMGEVRVYTPES